MIIENHIHGSYWVLPLKLRQMLLIPPRESNCMKEKQYLLTTQIYLFLALGIPSLIYGCCTELSEAAAHSCKLPERNKHNNNVAPIFLLKYVMNIHTNRLPGFWFNLVSLL